MAPVAVVVAVVGLVEDEDEEGKGWIDEKSHDSHILTIKYSDGGDLGRT